MPGGVIIKNKGEKLKTGKLDEPMLLLTLLLVGLGLVMLFSASYAMANKKWGDPTRTVMNQLFFALIGIVAMLWISKIDYHFLRVIMPVVVVVSLIAMILVPFIGTYANGARRWLFGFQPSEVAKFAMILFFAVTMSKAGTKKMKSFGHGFLFYMMCIGLLAGLLLLQKHLSAIIIVGVTGAVMMFVGGTRIFYLFTLAGMGIAGAVAYITTQEYAMHRVKVWLDPFIDFKGKGWQGAQSLMAIGSGGLFGLGLGQGRQKHLYLPEPANDFIFAVICEELGFVGAMLILIVFAAFIIRGYYIAIRAADKFGSLLAVGIITQIGFQIVFNICVVSGLVPVTGVSLPFFSSGGTSLLMILGEVGILLNISRGIKAPREE